MRTGTRSDERGDGVSDEKRIDLDKMRPGGQAKRRTALLDRVSKDIYHAAISLSQAMHLLRKLGEEDLYQDPGLPTGLTENEEKALRLLVTAFRELKQADQLVSAGRSR
jgi:hypothetical protein